MTPPVFPEHRNAAPFDPRIFSEGRELNMWGDPLDTQDIFSIAMSASLELHGKPVVCQDLLPELSMRIEARPLPAGSGPAELKQYIGHAWRSVAEVLIQRQGRLERDECVTLTTLAGVHVTLARTSGQAVLPPHAMRLCVDYSPVILARFLVARHEMPLIQPAHRTTAPFASVKQPRPTRLAPNTPPIAELIREARCSKPSRPRMTDSRACRCRCVTVPVAHSAPGSASGRPPANPVPSSRSDCGTIRFRSCDRISAPILSGGATAARPCLEAPTIAPVATARCAGRWLLCRSHERNHRDRRRGLGASTSSATPTTRRQTAVTA
ncbi:hypothetical protein BTI_5233 [Burkholderia thailandensis MSMB121]|uniref:hypothetical protein n=1 Tax=Burkholderia humptydooensis TaxID=430531 RepID=UPI000327F630|nr:hypothetical protein [Burkholderia humptydooensis]AGK50744.1 hypothetical protein BTI_5233 [Burkholderia thailandensis MSMB121]